MKYLFIILFTIINITTGYASNLIESKNINGIDYQLIKTTAKVTYSRDIDGKVIGKDLYFYNTQRKIAVSDITQKELEPYVINQKIIIYYVENSSKPNEQTFRVYLNKEDVQWTGVYDSSEVGSDEHLEANKIGKTPIHSLSGYKMKLVSEDAGRLYKFVGNNGMELFITFVFIGALVVFFLRQGHIVGAIIGLFMGGTVYLIFSSVTVEEESVFDMNKEEFYKGPTITEAKSYNDRYAKFKNIYGFQIIEGQDCSSRRSVECDEVYELNLVLTDNNRINIACHNDYRQIVDDAEQLSNILNKPLMNEVD